MNSSLFTVLVVLWFPFVTWAQKYEISGNVTSKNSQEPVFFATVFLEGTQFYTSTNEKGDFRISVPKGDYTIKVVMLGFESQQKIIRVAGNMKEISFQLNEMSLSLKDVVVTASATQSKEGSSTYSIGNEAIKQVQAISLGDVMSLLPGGKLRPQKLTGASQLDLRTTESSVVNSFGTAVVVDGTPLNNDANMQSENPSTSLSGGTNVVNKGIDLREIPVSNIESVEVVTGVAGAKYGNITSGAVIVTRKAGYTPLQITFNSTPSTYQASAIRGFKLRDNGYLNVDMDYAYSVDAPTELKYYYQRINAGVRWTTVLNEKKNWNNTVSFSFGYNGDGRRKEPQEVLLSNRNIRNSRMLGSINGRLSVLGKLSYTLSFNASMQYTQLEREVNDGPRPMVEPTATGTYFTTYSPLSYLQTTIMRGLPLNGYMRIEAEQSAGFAGMNLSFSTGMEYSYDKNVGKGRIVGDDGVGPSGLPGSRGVLFHEIPASRNLSLYHQTTLSREMSDMLINLKLGMRYDRMIERYNMLSPRIMGTIGIKKNYKIRGAWGIAYKAPSMITLYPGPVYFDLVNLSYYDPVPEERLAIVTSYVLHPDNSSLNPGKGETREISVESDKGGVNIRITGYQKLLTRGIIPSSRLEVFKIQGYKIISEPAGKPPVVAEDPKNVTYLPRIWQAYVNNQRSETRGVEVTIDPPRIKRTMTGLNLTGQYIHSETLNDVPSIISSNTSVSKSRYGVYKSWIQQNEIANANLTLIQQIPDLRLIVTLTTEMNFYSKTVSKNPDLYPVGYYDNLGVYIPIPENERRNEIYKDLWLNPNQVNPTIVPFYPNFHLNIRKETSQGHSFTFYANNCVWYNPYYTDKYNNFRATLNGKISFGFGITLKIH